MSWREGVHAEYSKHTALEMLLFMGIDNRYHFY